MAGQPIDVSGTPFVAASCTGCGTNVVCVPGYPDPLCLDCRRAATGIDWPWFSSVGEWHPTLGYPRELPPAAERPTPKQSAWAWGCTKCLKIGTAVNPDHAVAMLRSHFYDCPADAAGEADLMARLGRRASLSKLYPDEVPWMKAVRLPSGRLVAVHGRPS